MTKFLFFFSISSLSFIFPQDCQRSTKYFMTSDNVQGHPGERMTCPGDPAPQDYLLPTGNFTW